MKGVDLLVIQPTPFCNINCSYCYLPERSNPNRISAEVVDKIAESLLHDHLVTKKLSIVWHAGEPLVPAPGFYRPLFQLLASKLGPEGTSIQHHFQTNGTLLTQEWCDFILEYGISIGISIDGPKEVNDAKRKTRSGKGVFDKIMEGIGLLRFNKIPYHGIAVVSETSIDDPDGFFEFFYTHGFYQLGLNIEEVEGVHRHSSVFSEEVCERVTGFYGRLFELYMDSDKHMKIREFDRCLEAILRQPDVLDITKLSYESHQNTPMAILSVDYQGNFSTFSPELIGQKAPAYNDFILGNILTEHFLQPRRKDILQTLTNEINLGIKKCRQECSFFNVCGGGAPANKYFENGTFHSSDTRYCNFNIKIPTELVLSYMERKLHVK